MRGEQRKFVAAILASLFQFIVLISFWFRDIIIEATYLGCHTERTVRGLKIGFILFIISEVMFFFSFF